MKKLRIVALIALLCIAITSMFSCSKPVVVMEYKGETISTNMYSYWLSQIKSSYVSASNDTAEYWATKYANGDTYEQKMREIVDFNVKVNLICQKLFDDLGLKVDEKEIEEIENSLADMLNSYGSKSELNAFLSNYNVNYDMLGDIYKAEMKTAYVFDALYAKGGQREITSEILDEYFKNNYSSVDMIMIYNSVVFEKDENGKILYDETKGTPITKELSEDEKKAKNQLVEDIMKKLENGESFAELKKQYNEDPNKDLYTDGYYISSNDLSVYGAEIITTAQNMKIGEIKMVEDNSVICIMKKKELTEKAYSNLDYENQLGNIKEYCAQSDFNEYMSTLMKDVVVYSDEIAKLSIIDAKLIG